jgi:glycosyltransferase involved in cell wall biosynthesis
VGERIVFAGARTDVARMLHASDLFVLPTLTEALPTVIAEAMAAGLAIVATRVGGIPEMVEDGRNGLLIDAGDEAALAMACTRVLADHELSTRLAATGSLVVSERFDLSRQARLLRELYAELVADARGRR